MPSVAGVPAKRLLIWWCVTERKHAVCIEVNEKNQAFELDKLWDHRASDKERQAGKCEPFPRSGPGARTG